MPILGVSEFLGAKARDPVLAPLSQGQIRILDTLVRYQTPPTIGSMATAADISPKQASRCVGALAQRGLIERIHPVDGICDMRTTRIWLTEEGRIAAEKLARLYRSR